MACSPRRVGGPCRAPNLQEVVSSRFVTPASFRRSSAVTQAFLLQHHGKRGITMQRTGGCLCGDILFEISHAPQFVEYCHCKKCRKSVGAPVMAWALVASKDFKLLGGNLSEYTSSAGVRSTFCGRCATSVTYFAEQDPGSIGISTASFDDPDTLAPDVRIWKSQRVSWFETADNLPRYVRFKLE